MKLSFAALLILIAPPAFGCGLEFTAIGQEASSLKIVTPQTESRHIANIKENCTEPTGYILSISSLNQSQLKSSFGIGYPYQVSYAAETPVDLTAQYDKTYFGPSDGTTKPLRVILPLRRQARQGTYGDVLTVSISAR